MITEQIYKAATVGLAVLLITAVVTGVVVKLELNAVKKENIILVGRVATLEANIKVQNEAVTDMKARTKEYQDKIAEAEKLNNEANAKLQSTLYKLEIAKIPPACNDKIDFLRQGLMEMSN